MYAYGRLLLTKLPYRTDGGMMVIDDEVELTAYRNDSTFVLDFVNSVDEIQEAFKPYYEQTDPNQLYTLQTKLRQAPILRQLEIDEFAAVFFKPQAQQSKRDHGRFNKWIDPAVTRFNQEYGDPTNDEGEAFKSSLQSYIRLYSFLSQIIDWQDVELEKLYASAVYC